MVRTMPSLSAPAGLTKRFAILGGLIIIAACLAIGALQRHMAGTDLRRMAEHNNVALTRSFSNSLWPRYAEFLRSAHRLDIAILRSHPKTQGLRRDVLAAMIGLSVIKVKIYDLHGLTVFSTDASQIGDDKSGNTGFRSARTGHVVSQLVHRDSFNAFEQVIQDRDVFESYIPITAPNGEIEGVFEVYSDVTDLLQRIQASQLLQIAVVGSTFLILYLLLIVVVWRSERLSRKQHQENLELIRAAALAEESSRTKSEFLAHMSHELRTPLNAILGLSEVVKTQLFGPVGSPRYLEYAKDIWVSGQHLLAIIDDVLDMARAQAGQLTLEETEFDVTKALDDCLHEIEAQAEEAGVRLSLEAPERLPYLCADRRRVKQIVLNLLSNAVKYTPAGGAATIELSETPRGGLRIRVVDTGMGIAEEDIAKIVVPFGRVEGAYFANNNGAGLGLSISKALAAMHDARFEIASQTDAGTRVTVEFPPERVRRGLSDHGAEAMRLTAS